jgi:hypothetical protein
LFIGEPRSSKESLMTQFTSPRPERLTLRKPRNPIVAPSLMRQAGRHGHNATALRQQAERVLRKEVRQLTPTDRSP